MKKNKGFTLIEIIIATGILIMVGVAAVGVEIKFMGLASTDKHRLQATALAEEGISAVRAAFNTGILTGSSLTAGTYQVNADGSISSGNQPPINLNNVDFTRTITVN